MGIVLEGDDACQTSPVIHMDPHGLELTADDIGAVTAGSFQEAEGNWIDADDEKGAAIVGDPADLGGFCFDHAEIGRVLHVYRTRLRGYFLIK